MLTPFTLASVLAMPIVPVAVIGPPVRFSPVLICVTVPDTIPVNKAPLPMKYVAAILPLVLILLLSRPNARYCCTLVLLYIPVSKLPLPLKNAPWILPVVVVILLLPRPNARYCCTLVLLYIPVSRLPSPRK